MAEYNREVVEPNDKEYRVGDEEDNYAYIMSICKLSEKEAAIADEFVKLILNLIRRRPYDRDHLAVLMKYVSRPIFEMREELENKKDEIERQKMDLEHKLSFSESGSEEWKSTLETIGELILERRLVKDTSSIASVISTNLNRSGNFILGMDKRQYTPRSDKYRTTDIGEKRINTNPTTVKFSNIKK